MKDNNIFDNNSLSRLIAERITEEILTGQLKPGDKLVEATYAEEFGTSRAPIREAFYLLTIDGLVERLPRRGSIVKGYTKTDIIDLLEIRMMLENLAVDRIAQHGTTEVAMESLVELLHSMENLSGDASSKYTILNQKFHTCIIDMSQSEMIKLIYSKIGLPLLSLQRISFLREENFKKSIQEHQLIVDNLKSKEFEMARTILTNHNQEFLKKVLKSNVEFK